MKAGLDLGSTLTKAVWLKDDKLNLASTAETPLEQILTGMKKDGIKVLNISGVGYTTLKEKLTGFEINYDSKNPIDSEMNLQAKGVKILLEHDGIKLDDFLLVSIGTGTSYAAVTKNGTKKFPIGNSLGGGFLMGFSNAMGFHSYKKFSDIASNGIPLDLKVKDKMPETEGTFVGEMLIANLGKVSKETEIEEINASIVTLVATATIRDILILGMIPEFNLNNVVYIGSTLAHTPSLKTTMQTYSAMIGKNRYFPNFGEFSLAVGAYYQ